MTCRVCDIVCSRGIVLKRMTSAIACPSCEYVTCVGCLLTWLHQSPTNGCVNCRLPFTDLYLFQNIPKNQQKVHTLVLANAHIAADAGYMQATRTAVSRIIREESLKRRLHEVKRLLLTTMHALKISQHDLAYARLQKMETRERLAEMAQKVQSDKQCTSDVMAMVRSVEQEYLHVGMATATASVKCNNTPHCLGIVDENLHCDLCENTNCRDCGASYNGLHTCNPAEVESLAAIRGDSKSCPQCGVMIYRVSGCDHMWCSQCHVNFNWLTMAILRPGSVHNPDQVQYMRRAGLADRNPGDMPCDVLRSGWRAPNLGKGYEQLQNSIRRIFATHTANVPMVASHYASLRIKREMSGYVHPDTGRRYDEYTVDMYRADLVKYIKAIRIQRAIGDIMYMLHAGMLSLMGELLMRDSYPQMLVLRKIANKALKQTAAVFGGIRHKLTHIYKDRTTHSPLHYMTYRQYLITHQQIR